MRIKPEAEQIVFAIEPLLLERAAALAGLPDPVGRAILRQAAAATVEALAAAAARNIDTQLDPEIVEAAVDLSYERAVAEWVRLRAAGAAMDPGHA